MSGFKEAVYRVDRERERERESVCVCDIFEFIFWWLCVIFEFVIDLIAFRVLKVFYNCTVMSKLIFWPFEWLIILYLARRVAMQELR